jgi:hypothetical protein
MGPRAATSKALVLKLGLARIGFDYGDMKGFPWFIIAHAPLEYGASRGSSIIGSVVFLKLEVLNYTSFFGASTTPSLFFL